MNDGKTDHPIQWRETGQIRPPKRGEWFRGYRGQIVLAEFNFTDQSFPILELIPPQGPEMERAK